MKLVVLAVIGSAISKVVQGMKQGAGRSTAATAGAAGAAGGSDQWPPVPRREDEG
jgi:hypothetical protein